MACQHLIIRKVGVKFFLEMDVSIDVHVHARCYCIVHVSHVSHARGAFALRIHSREGKK